MKNKQIENTTTLIGIGASNGIAIGKAYVRTKLHLYVPEYKISTNDIPLEYKRLNNAINAAKRQIQKIKNKTNKIPSAAAEEIGYLLDAHLAMLSGSRLLRGVEHRVESTKINVEAAIQHEVMAIRQQFSDVGEGNFLSNGEEIEEVGKRLIRNLTNIPDPKIHVYEMNQIIISDYLSPAETILLNKKNISGFATTSGGAEGHTAILARSLGLPAVLGVEDLLSHVKNDQIIIIDGRAGHIIINPDDDTITQYQAIKKEIQKKKKKLSWLIKIPAISKDKTRITLQANMELPKELTTVTKNGAEGIGLLRSEFLFMNKKTLPSEEEHFQEFKNIILNMKGRPVTIRTLDSGSDKMLYFLNKKIPISKNPALGLRAIRLALKYDEILKRQLKSILRASFYGPVRILIPMISTLQELHKVKEIYHEVIKDLIEKKIPISDPPPPLGIMIEVPSAALISKTLAKHCDFMAIGTNDLTMYTLAIDRSDDQVAYLYNPLHPAVLKLIHMTVKNAQHENIPISICGEIAGDTRYTALLMGMGVRELSMSPSNLTSVKNGIRYIDIMSATKFTNFLLQSNDEEEIFKLIKNYNKAIYLPDSYS